MSSSHQIRRQFLDFFRDKAHTIVPSAPVVPHDDPTLLFTNAGMNQFKDVFLGTGTRDYSRAADSQKCIRAGGKHNDLDDVGQDTYHHTFFEMLGNWSFGDYFKKEAIAWAWELLTEVWGVDKTRLYATYFEGDAAETLDPDSEARRLWAEVTDIDPSHIVPGNKKDNFWEMGETGPCGPCTEIHVDLTPDRSGGALVNAGDARVIEIWNLVFIQYNRGSDGRLTSLPAKHVDTGMGFERITALLQGKSSNYDTDIFTPLFDAIRERTGAPAYGGRLPGAAGRHSGDAAVLVDTSYRVIADHLRTLTFALTDGAVISNEGRGYVLRRILRRAVRYARQYLDVHEPFLADLVPALVGHMKEAFPELEQAQRGRNVAAVQSVLREEEEAFGRTLDRGMKLFADAAEMGAARSRISASDAFKLHDTYGFPIDLTEQMASERGFTVDTEGYETLMEEARERARSAGTVATDFDRNIVDPLPRTDDAPKYERAPVSAKLIGFVRDGHLVSEGGVPAGATVALLLDRTPFYGEQGGQIGDRGRILSPPGDGGTKAGFFRVRDTQTFGEAVLHIGQLDDGAFAVGDAVIAEVESEHRPLTMKNHTVTHMLNWALREVLGDDVKQKGSLVDSEKTRFDLSHPRPITSEELERVESLVNRTIEQALPVHVAYVPQESALRVRTLRAVFGEKYPDPVRVVSVGAAVNELLDAPDDPRWMQFAVEFCGGTHLSNSAEAQSFAIVSEEGVAKGVRRVVGVTADLARAAHANGRRLREECGRLQRLTAGASAEMDGAAVREGVAELQRALSEALVPVYIRAEVLTAVNEFQRVLRQAEKAEASASGDALLERAKEMLASADEVAGTRLVVGEVPSAPIDAMRGAVDWMRDKAGSIAVLLATVNDGKVVLLAGMTKDVNGRGLAAGDLIKEVAPKVGGRGGGRPDMAQGGGTDTSGIPAALDHALGWMREKLS
ncbi:MAG: alanine--tRNA ligase [Candidatus Eisenbacteria bacterium]